MVELDPCCWISIAVVNAMSRSKLWEGRVLIGFDFYIKYTTKRSQSRNSSKSLEARAEADYWGMLFPGCLSMVCSPTTQGICLGMAPPTVGWPLPHQSLHKKLPSQAFPHAYLMEVIPQVRLPLPRWLECVPNWQNLSQHRMEMEIAFFLWK